MAAFMPGASPPLVNTAIFLIPVPPALSSGTPVHHAGLSHPSPTARGDLCLIPTVPHTANAKTKRRAAQQAIAVLRKPGGTRKPDKPI